jgi:hypothetical protein
VEHIPGVEIVPLNSCVEAMDRAFERDRALGWNDPVGAYSATAETLFWIDVVDEQLRHNHRRHYEATLADERDDIRATLSGLLFARNRITHEVDEIGYVTAAVRRLDTFAASWTWQSLHPPKRTANTTTRAIRKIHRRAYLVETLSEVTIFLGGTRNRIWQRYGQTPGEL